MSTKKTQEDLRTLLLRRESDRGTQRESHFRFGDPYDIDFHKAFLFNVGCTGEEFWGEDFEETIQLEATDGARAQLWDVPSIYMFELNQA